MGNIFHFLNQWFEAQNIRNPQRVFVLLVSLLLIALPLKFAVASSLMIILTAYTIFYTVKNKIKPHFTTAHLLVDLLYGLMVLSLIWTIDIQVSTHALFRNLNYLFIPFVFLLIPEFNDFEKNLIKKIFGYAMLGYALFFISYGVLRYFTEGTTEYLTHQGLVQVLQLNRVLVSIMISTALFCWLLDVSKSNIRYFALSLLTITLLLLSSKTIIIGTVLIFGIYFITQYKSERLRRIKYLIFVMVALLVVFVANTINKKFVSEMIPRYQLILTADKFNYGYYFNGAELRMLYTRFLSELIKEDNIFWTGYGLNNAQQAIQKKTLAYNMYPDYGLEFNFHNQFNQNWAEIGIFGVLLLILILYYGLKNAFQTKNHFMLLFISIYSLYLMTDTPLSGQKGIYLFFIFYFALSNFRPINLKKLTIFR